METNVISADVITTGTLLPSEAITAVTLDSSPDVIIYSKSAVINSVDWPTYSKTLEEILDEYKESIKLKPMTCINCGGSICSDSMTCEFCGTPYKVF